VKKHQWISSSPLAPVSSLLLQKVSKHPFPSSRRERLFSSSSRERNLDVWLLSDDQNGAAHREVKWQRREILHDEPGPASSLFAL
jgi:hypothetical protein